MQRKKSKAPRGQLRTVIVRPIQHAGRQHRAARGEREFLLSDGHDQAAGSLRRQRCQYAPPSRRVNTYGVRPGQAARSTSE